MPVSFPIQYELEPRKLDRGTRWLKLTLNNVGAEDLTALDVRLNSLDTYNIGVTDTGVYIPTLQPGEGRISAFQVSANLTGQVYITLDGWRRGERFHWESSGIWVTIGEEVGDMIDFEETLHSLSKSEGFPIELWTPAPRPEFEGPAETRPQVLSDEEESQPIAILPEEEAI